MSSDTRLGPNVAGTWYPADGVELSRTVDRLLAENSRSGGVGARVVGIISPHAGFLYSGSTAASAFNTIRPDDPRRVVLLGPSHYASFSGGALPRAGVYRTPLGEVPIDAELVRELAGQDGWTVDDRPFAREHCLEAEIPFLQRRLARGWSLVPALVGGGSSPDDIGRMAGALRDVVDPATLFVVSSDFTHFGPRFNYVPFRDDLPRRIEQLDMGAVEKILALDPQGFRRYVAETGATICGRHAIDVLLQVLPASCGAELVAYDTSGRTTGSFDHSVSYASVVFTWPATSTGEPGT